MGLIFIAMAIAAIVGGIAIIIWIRRSEEAFTTGSGCLAISLLVGGGLMLAWALYWT
jgi:drug/metabolite transporter superfamily protein YnfA